jgi:hypothetical protein
MEMSITEDTLSVIHNRLQELSAEATPEQLAYLAKAFETIVSNGKMIDIIHLSNQKLDELSIKLAESLQELETNKNTYVGNLTSTKNSAVSEIVSTVSQNVTLLNNLVNARKPELSALVSQFQNVNDVPENSSILQEIYNEGERRKFIRSGALPFVFGIVSRSNDYYGVGNFTDNLGNNPDLALQLLAGCHNYSTEYAAFYKEPSLCFLQGIHGNFIQKEMYLKYASNSTMYQYPYIALGVFFIKNGTNSTITTAINFGGSSYLEGAFVLVGTPNNVSETLGWQSIYSYASTAASFNGATTFTIPANTTVAVMLYTSSYYYTNTSSYYAQFLHWYVHSFRSITLVDGLEIDVEKTLKAWQCKGFGNTYDLWR